VCAETIFEDLYEDKTEKETPEYVDLHKRLQIQVRSWQNKPMSKCCVAILPREPEKQGILNQVTTDNVEQRDLPRAEALLDQYFPVKSDGSRDAPDDLVEFLAFLRKRKAKGDCGDSVVVKGVTRECVAREVADQTANIQAAHPMAKLQEDIFQFLAKLKRKYSQPFLARLEADVYDGRYSVTKGAGEITMIEPEARSASATTKQTSSGRKVVSNGTAAAAAAAAAAVDDEQDNADEERRASKKARVSKRGSASGKKSKPSEPQRDVDDTADNALV
jgi:hypothetical protein